MDFSTILATLLGQLWYFIPLFICIGVFKTPWFKGAMGEWQVNVLIKLFLNKADYTLIKNVTLPTFENGIENGTTQIDHIIVSEFGVFVVETKNMKGWIFGSANQKMWTQKIFKHSSKFQNPLHQNYKHLKTLESCLNINSHALFSVIIFIGDSTFKTKLPENVRFARGGIEYIKSKTERVLSANTKNDIVNTIESGKLKPSFKTNRQHVSHVKTIIEHKQAPKKERSETQICSRCGEKMVLRKAKKGTNIGNTFFGCSAFPKCRNSVEI